MCCNPVCCLYCLCFGFVCALCVYVIARVAVEADFRNRGDRCGHSRMPPPDVRHGGRKAKVECLLWVHFLPMSLFLLIQCACLSPLMMWNFSSLHMEQVLLPGLYLWHFVMRDHFIFGVGFSFLSQT